MKIEEESLRKKIGPAQCFRCQWFFHNSNFYTKDPCGEKHLSKECSKNPEAPPTYCHYGEKQLTNFLPFKQTTISPKINVWEERKKWREKMLLAQQQKKRSRK
ncbi:hypothetical protein NPIL_394501 [Nephila pilipes]|uniref:Uncharacterized protein n=1 Tax=Nephila pilipes TaxID=299642 RepID=A0A8X6TJ55_NEPPI|nr:hypothetical protein NPIL_394501 [Nephila pilipes]